VRIEFDGAKNRRNIEMHGVGLDFAARVLPDPNLVEIPDERFDYGEQRTIALGQAEGRLFVVVYTIRGDACRIISVRRANEREQRRYHQHQDRT
jgi:uncharacterized protein